MSGLREQLQHIHDAHGKLTPRIVLEEARDPESPLHGRFEWDDTVAAEKYRLEQAHELITMVRVVYRDAKDKPQSVRAFHAVPSTAGGFEYVSADEVARDAVVTAIVLRDMEREWRQLKLRYAHFKEFVEMVRSDLASV